MDNYSFVLVNINKMQFHKYIYDSITQLRLTNPDSHIYLCCHKKTCEDSIDELWFRERNVHIVDLHHNLMFPSHIMYKTMVRRNPHAERFFIVYELMRRKRLKNVIHIENDVMVYQNMSNFIEPMSMLYKVGITRQSDEMCIAGFVYLRNWKAAQQLARYFLFHYNKNDMFGLSDFCKKNKHSLLPVIPKGYEDVYEMTFESPTDGMMHTVADKYEYSECFESLKLIFDAAALGQYVGGVDKRVDSSDTSGFVNTNACYKAKDLNLFWDIDDGLKKPYIKFGDNRYPVANLHIHSKELNKYLSC